MFTKFSVTFLIISNVQVIKVEHEAHGVDVPDDLEKIERYMRERNLS